MSQRDPSWGAEFQRLALACALSGDLMSRVPGGVRPELFGSLADKRAQPPRQRIAAALAAYWEKYGARPPAAAFVEVMRQVGEKLGEAERSELALEVERVTSWPPPEDTSFVVDQVREWAEYVTVSQGLIRSSDLLDAGPSSLPAVRELLAKASAPIEVSDGREKTVAYLGDADARIEMWRRGEEYGERIPTGFEELDRVLNGGPTRRESFYFLAPPKGAKTASLLRVARYASRCRFGVYLATFEMQAIRMALRNDRGFARSSKQELAADLARLEKAIEGLRLSGAGEIIIDEFPPQMPNSVQAVDRRIDQLRRKGVKIDVAIFDYLNIMASARDEKEKRHELSRTSREISALAKNQDVLSWSAALVNRGAVNKRVIRKNDIAEAYEVISVIDGGVAICATKEMVANGYRRFYVVAAREEADEVRAGDYRVDFARMTIDPADDGEVDAIVDAADKGQQGD